MPRIKLEDYAEELDKVEAELSGVEEIHAKNAAIEDEVLRAKRHTIETGITGELRLTFSKAVIRRDEQGRVASIIGQGWRKDIVRDTDGQIVSVLEQREEEV